MKKLPISNHSKGNVVVIVVVVLAIFLAAFIGLGVLGFNLIKNFKTINTSTSQDKEYTTKFSETLTSKCGFTLGLPTLKLSDSGESWIYEEANVSDTAFRGLVPSNNLKNGVLMATMLYKTADERFEKNAKTFKFGQPGLVFYCVDNTPNWKLTDFVKYISTIKNDTLTYTINGDITKIGDIDMQSIFVKGVSDGSYYSEPFYVFVTSEGKANSRIVIVQSWSTANISNIVATDQEAILHSIASKEMSSKIGGGTTPTSNGIGTGTGTTTPTASCTQYRIRSGEFASDKCYSSKNLSDLQYYISKYDDAIFDYNGAAGQANVTCNGFTESFKKMCSQAKKDMESAKKAKEKYANLIKVTIQTGK